jgi:hypothetical protein
MFLTQAQIKIEGYIINFVGQPYQEVPLTAKYKERVNSLFGVSKIVNLKTDDKGFFSFEVKKPTTVYFSVFPEVAEEYLFTVEVKKDTLIELNIDISQDVDIDKKPVIYLYPQTETEVSLKLNINGKMTVSYPEYNRGWKVFAQPNGDLINIKDGSKHKYLFWEAENKEKMYVSDFETGFIVKGEDVQNFLENSLTQLGLNDYEKNDFITFWMPIMKKNKYNFVHFLINDNCDKIASLEITPKPDSELRVYMVFSAIDKPFNIEPQKLNKIQRTGFVLVEWGGIEIDNTEITNK